MEYSMKLHANTRDFTDLIRLTATHFNILPEFVEKDYWIQEYDLQPFSLNILDKRQTMLEKLVSLIRFSFAENPSIELAKKIRHFYDLYYLANDDECAKYLDSSKFRKDLSELFIHDQEEFDEPQGWKIKTIKDSSLINDFSIIWANLRSTYQSELTPLAFVKIPEEKLIERSFERMIEKVN